MISAALGADAQVKTPVSPDSSRKDTVKTAIPLASNAIKSKVKYNASDSMKIDLKEEMIFLYGNADVTYEDINLKASYIEMSFKTNIISARGAKDSTGAISGNPVFTQGPQSFQSKEMSYNFQTKKGRISEVVTKEGEGYIHGKVIKKDTSDNLYIERGWYSTCDLPHPHFYINATKLKVIKEDKIVTGPANLWIEDVPTPLAIPFGFFPNKKGRASGLLLPQYGESPSLGFFLRDGGYYWGLNDYVDLALTGDIFSKGSYAIKGSSNYTKRYSFNGTVGLDYALNRFPNESDFSQEDIQRNFFIKWRHAQDPKARPGSRFSADVNAGTSNYNKYNSRNSLDYLQNQFMSSINYSKTWKYASLTTALSHNQNTQNKIINLNLPTVAFSVNSFNPVNVFRKNDAVGNKWYDKVNLSYTSELRNEISSPDSTLFTGELTNKMRNGMRHTIPLRTNLNLFEFINISPTVNYSEVWYLQSTQRFYNDSLRQIISDTISGFTRASDISMAATAKTIYYGRYEFRNAKVKALRHVVTPSVGVSYVPERIGGITRIYDTTRLLEQSTRFDRGIYGPLRINESGSLNFGLVNSLEMKYHSSKDTSNPVKKIPVIENLSMTGSYNFLADSMPWSDIQLSARTNILQKFDIQLSATMSPYRFDRFGRRLNRTYWETQGRPGQITTARAVISFNFNPSARKRNATNPSTGTDPSNDLRYMHLTEYVDWSIPWSLNVNYTGAYNATFANTVRDRLLYYHLIHTLNFSGDINLTQKWKIGFTSGYDFKNADFTYTSLNIYRDLHCWEMRVNLVPFGERKMYSLEINVKSSTLRDLKLPMRRDWYDLRR